VSLQQLAPQSVQLDAAQPGNFYLLVRNLSPVHRTV
jgi:hypothetical protein